MRIQYISDKSPDEEITKAIRELGSFCPSEFDIMPGKSILNRARLEFKEWKAKSKEELSINPDPNKVEISRANPKGYPVFYCCSDPLPDYPIPLIEQTAVKEGSKLSRKCSPVIQFEYGYISRWQIIKPLKLAAFINFDFGKKANKAILIFQHQFREILYQKCKNPTDSWRINCILSELFARKYEQNDPFKYRITAKYSWYLMNGKYDGIIYPSVVDKGGGWNIALSQRAMDKISFVNFRVASTEINNETLQVTLSSDSYIFK